jgi:hypothetical protein
MAYKEDQETSGGAYWRCTPGSFLEQLIKITGSLSTIAAPADIRTHDLSDGSLTCLSRANTHGVKHKYSAKLSLQLFRRNALNSQCSVSGSSSPHNKTGTESGANVNRRAE